MILKVEGGCYSYPEGGQILNGISFDVREGRMLSVLVDGINEKLYDDFADTVIEGDPPAVVPDYQDELIERYLHGCE